MRLSVAPIVLLSGLVAASYGSGVAVSSSPAADLRPAARKVTPAPTRTFASVKPKALARPAAKFDTERVIQEVKSIDTGKVVSAVRGAVKSFDWPHALKGVQDAFLGINVAAVLKKYIIPVGIQALQELQRFSGEHVLQRMGAFKGREFLAQVRAFDTSLVWQAYEDFNVPAFLKAVPGLDLAPYVEMLKAVSPADLLDLIQGFTGEQLGQLALLAIDATHVGDILDAFGIHLQPLVDKLLPLDGASLLQHVEEFDGAVFLQWLNDLDGSELAEMVNKYANLFMTEVREVVASMTNGAPPKPFDGFDLFRSIDVVQEFVESIVGLKFPSGSAEIKNWTGARALEHFRKVGIDTLVHIATVGLKLAHRVGLESLKYINQKRAERPGLTKLGQPLVHGILDDLRKLTGEQILDMVRTLDLKPVVKEAKGLGVVELAESFTGIDFTPYADVLANFNGATFLANVQNYKGERTIKLLEDLGLTGYFAGFTGVNFSPIMLLAQTLDGAMVLDAIRAFDGKWALGLVEAATGAKLAANTGAKGPRPGPGPKRTKVKA